MKTLILYDSYFGNTEEIAKTITNELGSSCNLKRVNAFKTEDLKDIKTLIVGSPTRAFNFSDKTMTFLTRLPNRGLKGIKVTTFDTRIDSSTVKPKILGFLMNTFGYANKKIIKVLIGKGGEKLIEPEFFIVQDKEGPLKEGEIEKAKNWIKNI
jgi:flavodoxin I